MALWVCGGGDGCGTKYAVGLFRCPRCHNREFYEDGDPMAKISRYGGPSDKTLPVPEGGARVTPPTPMAVEKPRGGAVVPSRDALREHARNIVEPDFSESLARLEAEGGEGSSPGSSSSASTGAQQTSSEPSSKTRRKPARMTASRSGQGRTGSSSASGTAGGPETGTSETGSADE